MFRLRVLIATCVLALTIGAANAATFNWTYTSVATLCGDESSCGTESGSGSLTTSAAGLINQFTGTFDGFTIIAVQPVGGYGSNDNVLNSSEPYLDSSGVSFQVSDPALTADGGVFDIAIVSYYTDGSMPGCSVADCYGTFNDSYSILNSTGDFTISAVSATPLPAALPLFATGLGAMGLLGWRRKRKSAAVIAGA